MRARPMWRAPFKRYPKGGGPGVNPAMLAKRTPFNDFSPGSGRRQCERIKANGERCRCNAVQGATTCRVHAGLGGAMRAAKLADKRVRRSANGGQARRSLAMVALDALAEGETFDGEGVGLITIGRYVEARANSKYDPETWRKMLQCQKNILRKSQ